MGWRTTAYLLALLGFATACGQAGNAQASHAAASLPAACQPAGRAAFSLPSDKGLNYGMPHTASGGYLGTTWLRSDTQYVPGWQAAKPRFQADLDFIVNNNLGRVIRIFVGIDQLMVWNSSRGFVRFDDAAMGHLSEALGMIQAHHLTAIVVVFDQEEVSSPGNFHFQALDGSHGAMRAGYLRALDVFMRRFGSNPAVAAWDLFNEPYNSLGREGRLPMPPSNGQATSAVSPNYPDATVKAWLVDLYRTARCADPKGWFTFSDTTNLYWKTPPNTALYAGAVDFYDIHVYDNNPALRDWQRTLDRPFILGEVGGVPGSGLENDQVNAAAVSFWLSHGRQAGASAVLAQVSGAHIYTLTGGLEPTGRVVAEAP